MKAAEGARGSKRANAAAVDAFCGRHRGKGKKRRGPRGAPSPLCERARAPSAKAAAATTAASSSSGDRSTTLRLSGRKGRRARTTAVGHWRRVVGYASVHKSKRLNVGNDDDDGGGGDAAPAAKLSPSSPTPFVAELRRRLSVRPPRLVVPHFVAGKGPL